MKKTKKKKIDYLAITLGIVAVILTAQNIKQYIKLNHSHQQTSEVQETVSEEEKIKQAEMESTVTAEVIEQDKEKAVMSRLENMGEQQRMQYYYGMFLRNIKSGNYEDAYDVLYDEYKKNYFPTLETFKKYMDLRYTSNMTAQYTNMERNGDIYVLWVTLADLSKKEVFPDGIEGYDTFSINVVIQEYGFNDYKMSFSII